MMMARTSKLALATMGLHEPTRSRCGDLVWCIVEK
jgi:hypothetical protein